MITLISVFSATAAPDTVEPLSQTSGAYLKNYALRFTKAMDASGQKPGSFSISNKAEADGFYHLGIDLKDSTPPQRLEIKFKGGNNCLQMIEARIGKDKVYPGDSVKWSHLTLWHLLSSRQPGLSPEAVSIRFNQKKTGQRIRFLRTGDLLVQDQEQREALTHASRMSHHRYEMKISPNGHGANIRVNGTRSLSYVGKGSEADFRNLVKSIKKWNIGHEIQTAVKSSKIEIHPKAFYFTGAVSEVETGSIIATRNSLGGGNTSALVYFKSFDKDGRCELLVARAPVKMSDIDWESLKKAKRSIDSESE